MGPQRLKKKKKEDREKMKNRRMPINKCERNNGILKITILLSV